MNSNQKASDNATSGSDDFDRHRDVRCGECETRHPMALVRTDVDGFGMLRRYECVQCSALGTVEERPDASPAAEKDLKAYGSAQVERGGA